ncbi:lipocalin family protein [Sabulibacter ruber]|uniref:lipocalin family protein n=1 Tax=Sabulibacter ruber TaxID=2811901 RepID=UPI001A9610B3|nr:lipocalin family protein [Sabulibacter ruber]
MFKKTFLLTILAAFTLVFTSCEKDKDKKDPDPEPTPTAKLVGKEWKLTSQKAKVGNGQEQNVLNVIYEEFEVDEIVVEFDDEGGYMISSHGENLEDGTYEINGDEIEWNYKATISWLSSDEDILPYEFEINGNTLRLISNATYQGQPLKETITFTAQ